MTLHFYFVIIFVEKEKKICRRQPTKRGTIADEHYHWWKAFTIKENRKTPDSEKYRNHYGKTCADGSPESHLAPLDKDYIFK